MTGADGEVELDGTKLSPDEAAERWRSAGAKLLAENPDAFRRTFAMVEWLAAGATESTGPDEPTRRGMMVNGARPEDDPTAEKARTRILAAAMQAIRLIGEDPLDGSRFLHVDMMLRAIDWALVPAELLHAIFIFIVNSAPIDALVVTNGAAAVAPIPLVIEGERFGLFHVAKELTALYENESKHGYEFPVGKGGN